MKQNFKTFLESASFNIDDFAEDCREYLSIIGSSEKVLFHGSYDKVKDFKIEQFKERTRPRDSSTEVHNTANNFLFDKFGIEARNWLFVTGELGVAASYGQNLSDIYAIFPIGPLKWIYSLDIDDLAQVVDKIKVKIGMSHINLEGDEIEELLDDELLKTLQQAKWVKDENLLAGINSRNEIMLKCNSFYKVNIKSSTYINIIQPYLEQL